MSKVTIQNPLDLLTFLRFDIPAKTLYARHKEKKVEEVWAKKVYEHHLDVWGGFTERTPAKNGIQDFYRSYHAILKSIKSTGFNEDESYIPVLEDMSLLNGSHRVAAAIQYNKPVVCQVSSLTAGQPECTSMYFQNKKDIVSTGLLENVADSMALEYVRLKKNTQIATAYQHTFSNADVIGSVFKKYGIKIIYSKNITLTHNGQMNYMLALYGDEEWMEGSKNTGFPGAVSQASYNFSEGPCIKAILIEHDDPGIITEAKLEIRYLIGKGKGSMHTTDNRRETWRNACICFHTPTLDYINKCFIGAFHESAFKQFIIETKKLTNHSKVDIENFCVGGSASLMAYGKRDCRDFDILHLPSQNKINFTETVSSHNSYINYYGDTLEELIFNPKKYFYIDGMKFISLECLNKMKSIRGEEKDYRDIKLIESC